ncbi:hypothetical protein J437_LFUL011289 [Ladona fulva]|uniref:DUF4371 domain-containing protein n=1 Tax=Ladona fulva TaxID=123851 RepID=A0A8K0PB81_LADFU|nr:hypothetical protein J437_LFUL011289 [Ladona fulva]
MKGKCMCLLCGTFEAFANKHNVERHFQTNRGTFAKNYPKNSEIRKKKVCELKSKLSAQQSVFVRPLSKSKNPTMASFKIAHEEENTISRRAIQALQLSDSTALRRIEAIADDMQSQLKRDMETCEWFSLQFDESMDISDTSQLAVIIRMVFNDSTVKEELLKILPLKKRTREEDIYNVSKTHAAEIGVPLKKLLAITTCRALAMIGRTNSFVQER